MKMKTSLLTTLISTFLVFPLLVHSSNSPHLIDHTGSKVRSTSHYHMISAIRGGGSSGLGLHAGRHQRCPLDVIQLSSNNNINLQKGMILRFSPADTSGFIRESTDLNVKFSTTTSKGACQEQTVWKVDDYDESRGKWFITTGGIEGNPGPKTLQNWFKLEKTGSKSDTYKILHCPSVCPSCARLCYNVGISNDNGAQRLALVPDNEPALHVRLMPAGERSVSSVYDSK